MTRYRTNAAGEPENGSRVAVELPHAIWVFCRDDARAGEEGEPDRNWFIEVTFLPGEDASDRTWAEVCRLGPVAYVGVFVDRSVREAS